MLPGRRPPVGGIKLRERRQPVHPQGRFLQFGGVWFAHWLVFQFAVIVRLDAEKLVVGNQVVQVKDTVEMVAVSCSMAWGQHTIGLEAQFIAVSDPG